MFTTKRRCYAVVLTDVAQNNRNESSCYVINRILKSLDPGGAKAITWVLPKVEWAMWC